MLPAARENAVVAFFESNHRFHLRLVGLSGNGRLIEAHGQLTERMGRYMARSLSLRRTLERSLQEHREILDRCAIAMGFGLPPRWARTSMFPRFRSNSTGRASSTVPTTELVRADWPPMVSGAGAAIIGQSHDDGELAVNSRRQLVASPGLGHTLAASSAQQSALA
jgi:FCD domain